MLTVNELTSRARLAIKSGETSLRAAAEDLAAAQALGATQRQIAAAVGKSPAWVNRLLRWRAGSYEDDTAFGPQARASRQGVQRVYSTEQRKPEPATSSQQAQAAAARARAETAKAEAAKAKADALKAQAEAAKAKADAQRAKASAKAEQDRSFRGTLSGNTENMIHSGARETLVKALGMLGSEHAGERASAAMVVEKLRAKLGLTWDHLIIPANKAKAWAA